MARKLFSGVLKSANRLLKAIGYMFVALQLIGTTTEAGTCWMRMGSNGRCQYLWEVGVSKEKCCHGTGVDWAWSPHDNVTSSQRFYWQVIQHGAPECSRCHENCANVRCGEDKKCKMRRGEPRCVCAPTCTREGRRLPVCGSDGRTYRHHCALLKYNCRHSENVYVDYFNKCKRSCSDVRCQPGRHCVSDQNGLPHCLACELSCPRPRARDRPVCGSDRVTYPSMCHFREANCFGGGKISIAHIGRCRDNITCEEMKCAWSQKCLRDTSNGHLQCLTCHNYDCRLMESRGPLCGSDNKTYLDWCHMRSTACQTGIVIKTRHNGACNEGEGGSIDDYYYSSGSASFE